MSDRLLVIHEGTSSARAMLFDANGRSLGLSQYLFRSEFPQPGWGEQDPEEIWQLTRAAAGAMVKQAGGPDRIAAIGLTNQRETIVFWDRRTGRPLAPAIVSQGRPTPPLCRGG